MTNIMFFLGIALAASPFAAITVLMAIEGGWRTVLTVWGFVVLICCLIVGGISLVALSFNT